MAAKKKRQRNVSLVFCDKCDSPLLIGSATNTDPDMREQAELNRQYNRNGFTQSSAYKPILIGTPIVQTIPIVKPKSLLGLTSLPPKPVLGQVAPWPISSDYKIRLFCCACKSEKLVSMSCPSIMKDVISNMYQEVKSPQEIELQFKAFKFSKQKYSKSQVISVGCVDRSGLPYQFKGESSVKILYGAVKDRWFSTRVCWQKFWSKGKGDLGWRTPLFIQRPKIVDKVDLI